PHLQLSREPGDRPPHQADHAPARPRAAGPGGPLPRGARRRRTSAGARRVTVAEALRSGVERLAAAGVDTPEVDAELLVAHVLGTSRSGVHADRDREVPEEFEELLERRSRREPLAYVLGEWGFRRLTLKTDARALVPRPETEVGGERCLLLLRGEPEPRVLDLGTGTGAIALAIADEHPGARVTAVDSSAEALEL